MSMSNSYQKGKQLIIGIILGILTYWLFAQSLLNIAPHVQHDYKIDMSVVNIAVSLTSLLTGVFIVVAGGLSDKLGRVKMTNIGLILSIIGSLALIISNMPILLLTGRVLQGLSAACLLPSTIALINQFLLVKNGKSFKFLVIWLLWWYRFSVIIRWYYCNLCRLALDFYPIYHLCVYRNYLIAWYT